LLNRFLKKGYQWEVQKGWMSPAEYEERIKKKERAKPNTPLV